MAIDPKAKKTLDNRLASGDIDEDEYRRLLLVLSDEEQNVEQDAATSSQSAKALTTFVSVEVCKLIRLLLKLFQLLSARFLLELSFPF